MIHIVYDRNHCKVTIKGHANSDEKGKDLVCAAVSTLAFTLARNVEVIDGWDGVIEKAELQMEPGDTIISCVPIEDFVPFVTNTFDAIGFGFQMLSNKFQDFVTYKVLG